MKKILFPKIISKEIFEWIKIRSGFSEEELVTKFPKWYSWINGEVQPSLFDIEGLASKTHTPINYFYLDKPINEKLPVHDFRKITDDFKRPSPNLLETIWEIEERQNWLKEYLTEHGYQPLAFIGSYTLDSDIKEVADSIRLKLDLNEDWATKVKNEDEALRKLGDKIEGIGICVFGNGVVGNNTHRILNVEEFRGFVLPDKIAPVMFINNKDAPPARIFTMAHELAHLWINQSAIFNLDFRGVSDNRIEQFCDKVAAEFLVSTNVMQQEWLKTSKIPNDIHSIIEGLAKQFKVSKVVIARRALDMRKINKKTFSEYYLEMQKNYKAKMAKLKGGNFDNNQKYRVGDRFYSLVYRAVQEGSLLHRDAFDLTNLKSKSFKRYATKLEDKIFNY